MKATVFRDEAHQAFYEKYGKPFEGRDRTRQALFYLLGISQETRLHINSLYTDRHIRLEGLTEAWQTGSSTALTRLAFDVFHGSPVIDWDALQADQIASETERYSTAQVFSRLSSYVPYALEGLRIAYA